jgi:hypothetical protein
VVSDGDAAGGKRLARDIRHGAQLFLVLHME